MAYNSAYTGPQIDEAIGAVKQKESTWDGKQDKLSGTNDQVVGFNSAGEATAVPKPTSADVGAMPAVSGGTTGQVLTKTETGQEWQDAPDGLPSGGEEGQVLTKTASGAQWDDVPSDLPTGGTQGQVLTKGDGETVEWSDPASGLPSGGTPGQMLYQGDSGPEWGIPPYLGSMPQLDYSQMKSLHELGITDLNDVTEPGTYVGMSGYNYPAISNMPPGLMLPVFVMNVYSFVGPDNTEFAGRRMILQELFPFGEAAANIYRKFYRAGRYNGEILVFPGGGWQLQSSAAFTSFQPTVKIESDNVQAAIEEVNEKIPSAPKSVTVTLPASGWSSNTQTVTVSGVLADETKQLIQPMPAIASQNAYITAGVICSGQAANQLTFKCSTVPTDDISLYVVITEVRA